MLDRQGAKQRPDSSLRGAASVLSSPFALAPRDLRLTGAVIAIDVRLSPLRSTPPIGATLYRS